MFSREGPRRGPDEPRVEHGVRMASTARRPRIMYQRHEVLPGDVGQNRDERRNEFAGEHVVGLPHGERASTAAAWYDTLVEMQNGPNILPVVLRCRARPPRSNAKTNRCRLNPIRLKSEGRVSLRELLVLTQLCREGPVSCHHKINFSLGDNLRHEIGRGWLGRGRFCRRSAFWARGRVRRGRPTRCTTCTWSCGAHL